MHTYQQKSSRSWVQDHLGKLRQQLPKGIVNRQLNDVRETTSTLTAKEIMVRDAASRMSSKHVGVDVAGPCITYYKVV